MSFGIAAASEIVNKQSIKTIILIFFSTRLEHIKRVRTVLKRIKEASLKLSREKCKFFRTDTKFLGHIINKQSIRIDDLKIK